MSEKIFTVLVVDDISENINLAVSILLSNNYDIGIAESGKKALHYVNNNKPDLILLDIMMPEMDGFEVCEILKSNEDTKDIPIIFLTAKNEKESIVKGFELGAVDFISKPFFEEELIARVSTHLKLKEAKVAVEKQNKHITDSIEYAKLIQSAVLPSSTVLSYFLPDNFVFYRPRDIVSGDFYWIKQIDNHIFVSVADCTGHGVPGAFMSMLGIAYLNEIVYGFNYDHEIKASSILDELRKKIKSSLHQEGRASKVSDGMDMSLCILNIEDNTMQFAGANSPLVLIRENQETNQRELFEYKPDRMPVAVYIKEKPFTNNVIELKSNDRIYLYSDGFIDQIGGEKERKFLNKNFKKLLLENSDKSMQEQGIVIQSVFDQWKEKQKQIDDVLVLGFEVLDSYGDIEYF